MGNVESPPYTVAFFCTAFRAEKPTDAGTTVAPTSWFMGTAKCCVPNDRKYVSATAGEKSTLPYPGFTESMVSFRVPVSRICGRNAANPREIPLVGGIGPENSPVVASRVGRDALALSTAPY